MNKILSIVFLIGLFSLSGFSDDEKRVSVLLPVNSGAVVYAEDEHGNIIRVLPERKGRFAELYVRPRVDPDTPDKFYVPKDFFEAVRELKLMLPPDYLEFILEKYGFVDSIDEAENPRKFTDGLDDRILDLNFFLFNIWDLGSDDQKLTKQMKCMGMFEFDFTALYVELALQEIVDEGGYYTRDMDEAVYLTGRLEVACLAE